MTDRGLFVVSLDFELFWGIHDAFEIQDYYDNVNNVRRVIPQLLDLFNKYHIRATFATVGAIYHSSFEQFKKFSSDVIKPVYAKSGLSPYEDANLIKEEDYPELHFSPECLALIREYKQEIGTHTYSHYYCTEPGVDLLSFESDIKKAIEIARINGDEIKTIVFPRNQIANKHFLAVLAKYGIHAYRGNPYGNYSRKSVVTRIHRFLSSYFTISSEMVEIKEEEGIINIPASHFLRPFSSVGFLNSLQLRRIKRSMKKAAKEGKVYHLWWHPHNMGGDIVNNMKILEEILQYYCMLNAKYEFKSVSMSDVVELYLM